VCVYSVFYDFSHVILFNTKHAIEFFCVFYYFYFFNSVAAKEHSYFLNSVAAKEHFCFLNSVAAKEHFYFFNSVVAKEHFYFFNSVAAKELAHLHIETVFCSSSEKKNIPRIRKIEIGIIV